MTNIWIQAKITEEELFEQESIDERVQSESILKKIIIKILIEVEKSLKGKIFVAEDENVIQQYLWRFMILLKPCQYPVITPRWA